MNKSSKNRTPAKNALTFPFTNFKVVYIRRQHFWCLLFLVKLQYFSLTYWKLERNGRTIIWFDSFDSLLLGSFHIYLCHFCLLLSIWLHFSYSSSISFHHEFLNHSKCQRLSFFLHRNKICWISTGKNDVVVVLSTLIFLSLSLWNAFLFCTHSIYFLL